MAKRLHASHRRRGWYVVLFERGAYSRVAREARDNARRATNAELGMAAARHTAQTLTVLLERVGDDRNTWRQEAQRQHASAMEQLAAARYWKDRAEGFEQASGEWRQLAGERVTGNG